MPLSNMFMAVGGTSKRYKINPNITMFDFKISMIIKRGGSGRAVEEYNSTATDGLVGLLESKK